MFKRFWWVFLVMIPVGAIIGLLVAAVITYVMPKKYESQAIIEVKPVANPMTPHFFGTEFEKIKSHNSLGKVVDGLELANKWSMDKETAIQILKGIITTENIRGTDLISVKVHHTNKGDARDIAGEVARSYRGHRLEVENRAQEQALLEINTAVRDQEDKVEEGRKVLSSIQEARKKNIGLEDSETLLHVFDSHNYIEAKRVFETDQELLQSMKIKLVNETISEKVLNDSIVIHDEPRIAQAPFSPRVTINLLLGTALGFLLSPLLSLPVILLLNRLMPARVSP